MFELLFLIFCFESFVSRFGLEGPGCNMGGVVLQVTLVLAFHFCECSLALSFSDNAPKNHVRSGVTSLMMKVHISSCFTVYQLTFD